MQFLIPVIEGRLAAATPWILGQCGDCGWVVGETRAELVKVWSRIGEHKCIGEEVLVKPAWGIGEDFESNTAHEDAWNDS